DEHRVDPQAKTKSDRKSSAFAEAKTASGTGSKRRAASAPTLSSPAAELATAAIEPAQLAAPGRVEDRTSSKMGWEHEGEIPATRARPPVKKLALYALPVVALAGLGVWKLSAGGGDASSSSMSSTASPVAAAVAPAAAPSVTPLPVETPTPTPVPAPAPAPAAAVAVAAAPAPVAKAAREATVAKAPAVAKSVANAEVKKVERPAPAIAPPPTKPTTTTTKAPTPAPVATAKKDLVQPDFGGMPEAPKPAATAPAVAATVPAKPEAPKPAAAPAVAVPAAPVVVETPPMAKLSAGSVSAVASQHSRELAKCEGGAQLSGEITVRFEINAAGRVVKSQVSSTLKNPKVTGCILMALRTWQFPKPSTGGGAEGTYTMSYQ
ncbi:MAG: AgmX/PglI C-terminal domain-containing protein, partial [Myxococcales bacterium]|nr:AgmX/PglI C-terminal domain-containing protein [Myxococcales bacterium]